MILETLDVDPRELAQRTGWSITPQGACKGDICVPVPAMGLLRGGRVDVRALAERLHMPLIHDEPSGLWCLGPESGGRALTSVQAPALRLPRLDGSVFSLASLCGRKVLLVAWASW
jgi:hypothetical protein